MRWRLAVLFVTTYSVCLSQEKETFLALRNYNRFDDYVIKVTPDSIRTAWKKVLSVYNPVDWNWRCSIQTDSFSKRGHRLSGRMFLFIIPPDWNVSRLVPKSYFVASYAIKNSVLTPLIYGARSVRSSLCVTIPPFFLPDVLSWLPRIRILLQFQPGVTDRWFWIVTLFPKPTRSRSETPTAAPGMPSLCWRCWGDGTSALLYRTLLL